MFNISIKGCFCDENIYRPFNNCKIHYIQIKTWHGFSENTRWIHDAIGQYIYS